MEIMNLVDTGKNRYVKEIPIYLSQIPRDAGKLTLKYRVFFRDYWPLPVFIVLREHGAAHSYAVGQKQPVMLKPGDVRLRP